MFRLFECLLLLLVTAQLSLAQNSPTRQIDIGSQAPPLTFEYRSKVHPVEQFQKGQVYVLEFWATWCQPCLLQMPHLSALAKSFSGEVQFIGVDVYETESPAARVKAVFDSVGNSIVFPLATDDDGKMVKEWIKASGQEAIPISYVVDQEGRIAWIGYPTELDNVLSKVVDHTWNLQAAIAEKHEQQRLDSLTKEMSFQWAVFGQNPAVSGDRGKPDSLLLAIENLVRKEPKLETSDFIFESKFGALLKTNPHGACRYAQQMQHRLPTGSFDNDGIFLQLGYLDTGQRFKKEIYKLSIQTLKARIQNSPTTVVPEFYHLLASFYARLGRRKKAIANEEIAIANLTQENHLLAQKMPGFEAALKAYKSEPRRQLRFKPHIHSGQFL